jgi:hypothetical protein
MDFLTVKEQTTAKRACHSPRDYRRVILFAGGRSRMDKETQRDLIAKAIRIAFQGGVFLLYFSVFYFVTTLCNTIGFQITVMHIGALR